MTVYWKHHIKHESVEAKTSIFWFWRFQHAEIFYWRRLTVQAKVHFIEKKFNNINRGITCVLKSKEIKNCYWKKKKVYPGLRGSVGNHLSFAKLYGEFYFVQ